MKKRILASCLVVIAVVLLICVGVAAADALTGEINLSLYEQIMSAEDGETLYSAITSASTQELAAQTTDEISTIWSKAKNIYCVDVSIRAKILEKLETLPNCNLSPAVDRTGWILFEGQDLVDGNKYYLNRDISVTQMVQVSGSPTLDLNGFALIADAYDSSSGHYCRTININVGAHLTIIDSNPTRVQYGTVEYVEDMTGLLSADNKDYLSAYTDKSEYRQKAGLWKYNKGTDVPIYGGIITGGKGAWHGGTILNMGKLTMKGGTIVGGYATSDYQDENEGFGGGGAILSFGTGAVTRLEGNAAVAYCMTKYYGGGIVCWGGSRLEMAGQSAVYGCYSNIGGGVFIDGCRIGGADEEWKWQNHGNPASETGSVFAFESGNIYNCVAGQGGSGIYLWYYAHLTMNEGSVVHHNYTPNNAAGVGVSVGASDMVLNGGAIQYNRADARGGGVETIGGDFTMYSGTIKGNSSGMEAGAIACSEWTAGGNYNSFDADIGKVIIYDGIIEDNHTEGDGGAFHVIGQVEMYGGIVRNCTAANGGLFYIGSPTWKDKFGIASILLSGGSISDCTATNNGGAAYVNAGKITMTGGAITDCAANNNGGAFYITEGTIGYTNGTTENLKGTFSMSGDAAITNCDAVNGGAIYINGGNMTMTNGEISLCDATNGGAAHITDGNFTMEGGTMQSNGSVTGTEDGGAVYVNNGNVTIGLQGCTQVDPVEKHQDPSTHPIIKDNAAKFGGGFAIDGGSLTMYCCKVFDNISDNRGTGTNIFINGGSFTQYYAGADIGTEKDHGIVMVGGKMDIADSNDEVIVKINYHANYSVSITWTTEAPESYILDLPYCPEEWSKAQDENGFVFIGWSVHSTSTEETSIRDKGDYLQVGEPFEIKDKHENGEINLYALWAPKTSSISYAYTTGGVISSIGSEMYSTFFGDATVPTTYNYTLTTTDIGVPVPSKPGYTFKGWKLYASMEKISNWGADLSSYSDSLTCDMLADEKFTWEGKVLQNFGDITLVAVFEECESTINYQIVGPEGENAGTLTTTTEKIPSATTNAAQGTTVTAATGFKVVGWYTDAACTVPVSAEWLEYSGNGSYYTSCVIKPIKSADAIWPDTITYYVKIEYAVADLTIKTEDVPADQCYIFTITGTPSDRNIAFESLTIALHGEDIVIIKDLPVGSYTVTEQSGWSWRVDTNCDATDGTIVIDGSETHTITFSQNGTSGNQWLDDEAYFGGNGG